MAVHETSIIDIVSIGNEDTVSLTISDHLDWTNTESHFAILKEKINSYCQYIENGQLYDEYPETRDRRPIIRIIFVYPPTAEAGNLLKRIKSLLNQEGFVLNW